MHDPAMTDLALSPSVVVETYRLNARFPLFLLGTFDERVTVLSQQYRALNLAWAMIESRLLPTKPAEGTKRVAVVGAGFAGLTFAAALMQKRCACDIVLFEERDALLPLQQGSDTRCLF
jgi:NAD(P)-binding Rossmann-like domain